MTEGMDEDMVNVKNVFRRKGRTVMTLIAVATSMALLLSMQAISEGLLQSSRNTIEKSRVDIGLGVSEGHGIEGGHALLETLKKDPEVRYCGIYMTEYISFRKPGTSKQGWAITEGIVPKETKPILHPDEAKNFPKDGYFGFVEGGDPHYENNFTGKWTYEALIDKNIASSFGLQKGDQIQLARTATGPYLTFNISGVFDSQLTGSGVAAKLYFLSLHLSELQSLTLNDVIREDNKTRVVDRIDQVSLGLQPEIRTDKHKVEAYKKELEGRYPFYNVVTRSDRLQMMEQQMTIVNGFFVAIGGVSLMIGMLFVTCVMFMTILERTNEIGMLRAIGISRRTIFVQILAESMIIVVIGAAVGIVPGYFGSLWGADYIRSTIGTTETLVLFSPRAVGQLFVEVILLGGFVSIFPAWRAMSMDIIKSLKRVK